VRIVQGLSGVIVATLAFLPAPAAAQIQLSPVVSGLTSPVFVGNAGDGSDRLFIVEQGGIIKVLQPGSSTPTVFLNITPRVLSGGERGLLGLAFHPQYTTNRRFFVFYTQQTDGMLVIADYFASATNPNIAETAERRILTIPHSFAANHNGGMIAFGGDGYLYIGVGDGGGGNDPQNNAQNKNNLLGKILRIDINAPGVRYAPAPGNPFIGATEGRDEIYAYGMRNPWRFSFDRQTDQMWVGDVGQSTREEVDAPIVNGGNYGWRIYEGTFCTGNDPTLCTDPPNYIPPLFEYNTHVNGRCAVTGGYVYRGLQAAVPTGRYIYGDYCSGEILSWNGATQTVLLNTDLFISSFGEDEAGEVYVVNLNGSVSKIIGTMPPPPPPPTCTYSISPTRATFASGGGNGAVTVTVAAGCAWTATSNVSWITVTGGSPGNGNGTVTYSVAPYTGKPKNRNGTVTIAGQTFSVKQSK
jgi:glucose/arabinose dehydrogenase